MIFEMLPVIFRNREANADVKVALRTFAAAQWSVVGCASIVCMMRVMRGISSNSASSRRKPFNA
jgi:hypothetical protein